jgi:choline kinase
VIAVILAAGLGIRLRPLTHRVPKGLIEIGGKTLLEHSIENLSIYGISKTIIVIGHLGEMIKGKFNENYMGMEISYVENTKYSKTGSMYSFSMTRDFIDDDVIILDGDLLYEHIAIKNILTSGSDDCTIVTNISGSGDEVYVCADKSARLSWLGKNIPANSAPLGEFIGITKLSRMFLDKLFDNAADDYQKGDLGYFFEDVLYNTNRSYDDYPVYAVYLPDLRWIEIDKESDYVRAINIVYPQIKK